MHMFRFLHRLFKFVFRPVILARLFFVLLTTWCGVMLAEPNNPLGSYEWTLFNDQVIEIPLYERWLYSLIAFTSALIITIIEFATNAISSHKILMAAMGLLVGLIFGHLLADIIPSALLDPQTSDLVFNLFFGYFGIILAIKHAERFHLSRLRFFLTMPRELPKVLDSSVIIDGRIRELINLQVLTGPILIPNFVLREIQGIADSTDPNRKARGRRGLDVLEELRETCKTLELLDKEYPEVAEVDQKLVQLCREMDADLVTNDYNLQKIAHLHRIHVMNLNELANALRPTVYIGETFHLNLVREGKELGQGVGYLDDGTMVVVDNAKQLIGQEVQVLVSSILQTSSGRLVFARLAEEESSHHANAG